MRGDDSAAEGPKWIRASVCEESSEGTRTGGASTASTGVGVDVIFGRQANPEIIAITVHHQTKLATGLRIDAVLYLVSGIYRAVRYFGSRYKVSLGLGV